MFNSENRPICAKCNERVALTLYNDLWICGECMNEFIKKQIKLKQELFLKE